MKFICEKAPKTFCKKTYHGCFAKSEVCLYELLSVVTIFSPLYTLYSSVGYHMWNSIHESKNWWVSDNTFYRCFWKYLLLTVLQTKSKYQYLLYSPRSEIVSVVAGSFLCLGYRKDLIKAKLVHCWVFLAEFF